MLTDKPIGYRIILAARKKRSNLGKVTKVENELEDLRQAMNNKAHYMFRAAEITDNSAIDNGEDTGWEVASKLGYKWASDEHLALVAYYTVATYELSK